MTQVLTEVEVLRKKNGNIYGNVIKDDKRIQVHKREERNTNIFNISKADERIGTNVPPGFHCPQ